MCITEEFFTSRNLQTYYRSKVYIDLVQEIPPPDLAVNSVTVDVDKFVIEGCQTIMDTAATFTLPHLDMQREWDETHPR